MGTVIATATPREAFELILDRLLPKAEKGDYVLVHPFVSSFVPGCLIKRGFLVATYDWDHKLSSFSPPESLIDLKFEKTKAIIGVHLFGSCNPIKGSQPSHTTPKTIYDCSHALGVLHEETELYCGNFGDASFFSLNDGEIISGGTGGLVTLPKVQADPSNDLEKLRSQPTSLQKYMEKLGCSLQELYLSEVNAALALSNFLNIQEIQEHHYNVFQWYCQHLPDGCVLKEPNTLFSNYSYIPIQVDPLIRNKLLTYLTLRGVHATIGLISVDATPYDLPTNSFLSRGNICLPTGITLDETSVKEICNILKDGLNDG